jgi:predicted ATPase
MSQQNYIGIKEIANYLEPIIKRDYIAKVVSFLVQFSTYLLDDQLNLIIASLSSTGKTHILQNIAKLFPQDDVKILGYTSPKAFFHELWIWDEKRKKRVVPLEKVNLIFQDQPHPELLAKLRPILSHDKKEIEVKITDKSEKGGNLTKTILVRGFPAVSFATTYLKLDDQEITRALIISPEISQEKIRESVELAIREKVDSNFYELLENEPGLKILRERILGFKEISKNIRRIVFVDFKESEILSLFKNEKSFAPKDMRNIKKFMTICECFAGLNYILDRVSGDTLLVKREDIMEAVKVWNEIGKYQEIGIMPFALEVYYKVILPLHKEGLTLTKKVIMKGIKEKFSASIQLWYLEQHVLPTLESGGFVSIEKNPQDRRQIIVIPLVDVEENEEEDEKNERISELYLPY